MYNFCTWQNTLFLLNEKATDLFIQLKCVKSTCFIFGGKKTQKNFSDFGPPTAFKVHSSLPPLSSCFGPPPFHLP